MELHHGLQRMTRTGWFATAALTILVVARPHAQTIPSARVAVLQAEDRGVHDARDLATLRAGVRNADGETARAAIRALGRLGRPVLLPDIAVALRSPLPELRAEAADAIASSLSGASASASTGGRTQPAGARAAPATSSTVATALSTLLARLAVEAEPGVRAAICEALGRIPYSDTSQITRAEGALLSVRHNDFVTDRLGVVKGLESIVRVNAGRWTPSAATITALRELVGVPAPVNDTTAGAEDPQASQPVPAVPLRDARIRRLAIEALITVGEADSAVIEHGAVDPDPQVRRLAMRAAGVATGSRTEAAASALRGGRSDPSSMVRMEALRGESAREKGTLEVCQQLVGGFSDPDTQVALVALDLLGDCGTSPDAVTLLEHTVNDLSAADSPRGWHLAAHALVALSRAAPDRASAVIDQFTTSTTVPLREYAARAAIALDDRVTLEKLASDANDRVAQIAGEGLGRFAPPLDVQADRPAPGSDINAADLQRFAAPRARVTIRGVGSFEVALFTREAPAAVLRFARLAQAGHYDGTTLVGVQPTLIGLTPRAGPGSGMRSEAGSWPHVRGAMGLSPGDSETGAAEIFIDLVDNPRFDHRYAVFAQVLNGIDVLDQILEGDVIERIEIVTGR